MKYNKGFIAGAFDIIHPGYIKTFEETKNVCNYLIVALHSDPTIERPSKLKPVLSAEERKQILLAIKYVDEIVLYDTEEDLFNLLKNTDFDVRFLGDDYKDKDFTGKELSIPIHFCSRKHNWSATKFKRLIFDSIHGRMSREIK